mmetsp:Transcript_19785/g.37131  ORF Transcript_19785/g.37131 Transcript_19785/m.37131 type:complete len:652 (-) Transcript_19785:41-1996(-)
MQGRPYVPRCWSCCVFRTGFTVLQLLYLAQSIEMASVVSGANWILRSDGAVQQQRGEAPVSHLMRSEPRSRYTQGAQLPEEMVVQMMEMGSFRLVPGLEHLQDLKAAQPGSSKPAVGSKIPHGMLARNWSKASRRGRRGRRAKRHRRARRAGSAGNKTFRKLHKLHRKRAGSRGKRKVPTVPEKADSSSILPASAKTLDADESDPPDGFPFGEPPAKIHSNITRKEKPTGKNSTEKHIVGGSSKGGFQVDPSNDEFKVPDRDGWESGLDSRDAVDDDWDGDDDDDSDADQRTSDNSGDDEDDEILPNGGDVEIGDNSIINITSTKDASAKAGGQPLKAADNWEPTAPPQEPDIMKLGEGIGAMAYERSPSGSRSIDHDLERRLELQDCATVIMLLVVFAVTILLSCCSVYQVAEDLSPASYYSEPRPYQQRLTCETADLDNFLAAFNLQPQNIRLRIIGKNPEPGGFRQLFRSLNPHAIRPRGLAALLPNRQRRRLAVLFDVSLDLTPFIAGEGRLNDDNLTMLQKYLASRNSLETVLLQKRVDWVHWEDVATNVRQRLRTLGFPGDVAVHFEAYDEILVYKNHKWSNFVRNRVTQALVVISMVGGIFWLPYIWVRQRKTVVETRFRINLDPSRYWELVSDGLSAAEGFNS